jgi:hypothetical protein
MECVAFGHWVAQGDQDLGMLARRHGVHRFRGSHGVWCFQTLGGAMVCGVFGHWVAQGDRDLGIRAEHSIFLELRFGFSVLKNFGFSNIRNRLVF